MIVSGPFGSSLDNNCQQFTIPSVSTREWRLFCILEHWKLSRLPLFSLYALSGSRREFSTSKIRQFLEISSSILGFPGLSRCMGFTGETMDSMKSIEIRKLLTLVVCLGMIVTSLLITGNALMCIIGIESPLAVALSGSMEPGIKRGDVFFLHMSKDPIRAGEIVSFIVDVYEIPITHRVIKVHERQDTCEVDVLTKGDNNFGNDRPLYANGQRWLQQHYIIGRAVGFVPYVGWLKIIFFEKPIIKYILFGTMGLLVLIFLTSND